MYALYSLLTAAGMLLLSPYFLLRGLIQGKYLSNMPERLGWRFPPELREETLPAQPEKSIWIHAVSVGEVLAVLPLAEQLKKRFPQRRLVVSTTTVTGQKIARERMPFADAIFYFPLDWRGPVRRALDAARPGAVIIVETEIWPNFLRECRRAEVPVIFVNGRLSERSFRGYGRALSYSAGALCRFSEKSFERRDTFSDAKRRGRGAPDRLGRTARASPRHRQSQIRSCRTGRKPSLRVARGRTAQRVIAVRSLLPGACSPTKKLLSCGRLRKSSANFRARS